MPKTVPGIKNEILLANLHKLSEDILIPPEQVGMILGGRTKNQLCEDRAKGTPPPSKLIGGSVRYRLGDVLAVIRNTHGNSAQAAVANKLSKKNISSFSTFLDNAAIDDPWPFIISGGKPKDFFAHIEEEDAEASCKWLTLGEYLSMRFSSAEHEPRQAQVENLTPGTKAEQPPRKIVLGVDTL